MRESDASTHGSRRGRSQRRLFVLTWLVKTALIVVAWFIRVWSPSQSGAESQQLGFCRETFVAAGGYKE